MDIAGSAESLDKALVLAGRWMDQEPLSEQDVAVLAQVGVSWIARVCAGGGTQHLPVERVGFLAEGCRICLGAGRFCSPKALSLLRFQKK
jgi:hypothetical protein